MDPSKQGIENKTRIDGLETQVNEMSGDIKEIKDNLLSRPSWVVTFLLGGMCSVIVALASLLLHVKVGA